MTDAERREKVMKGLEICTKSMCSCEGCPYLNDSGITCDSMKDLMRDAFALLKEQETLVVITADFGNNPNLDDGYHLNVREEYKDGSRCGGNTINVIAARAFKDQDLRRYWTSNPTPGQMWETPWEGDADDT